MYQHDTEIYYNRTFQPEGLHQPIQKERFRLSYSVIINFRIINIFNKVQ